jgi:hypothetical protein
MVKLNACRRWSFEFTGGGRQCWPLVLKCFGLLEGEDAREWLQSSVNSMMLLFIYL